MTALNAINHNGVSRNSNKYLKVLKVTNSINNDYFAIFFYIDRLQIIISVIALDFSNKK
jgi:hypothetical protein